MWATSILYHSDYHLLQEAIPIWLTIQRAIQNTITIRKMDTNECKMNKHEPNKMWNLQHKTCKCRTKQAIEAVAYKISCEMEAYTFTKSRRQNWKQTQETKTPQNLTWKLCWQTHSWASKWNALLLSKHLYLKC